MSRTMYIGIQVWKSRCPVKNCPATWHSNSYNTRQPVRYCLSSQELSSHLAQQQLQPDNQLGTVCPVKNCPATWHSNSYNTRQPAWYCLSSQELSSHLAQQQLQHQTTPAIHQHCITPEIFNSVQQQ